MAELKVLVNLVTVPMSPNSPMSRTWRSGRPECGSSSAVNAFIRSRARCEDRIRIAKDTELANFPLKRFDQNWIRLAIVALAGDPRAWSGLLAFAEEEIHQ